MKDFDHNQLASILRSAGIKPSNKIIRELESRLIWGNMIYWVRKKTLVGRVGPSIELINLYNALRNWLVKSFDDTKDLNEPLPTMN